MKTTLLILVAAILLPAQTSCRSREEQNKKAEETGQAATEKKAGFLKGVGEGLKGAGKEAIESVSEGIGEVIKGANEGFDKSMVRMEVRVPEEQKAYITASRTEVHTNDSTLKKEIIVYIVFEKDCDGKLLLKAYDNGEEEIGRSAVTIKETSDNSRFVGFPFDERTPFTLIQYLTLEYKSK
ncbi:MAG: hypothetical protein LBT83_04570 [Tannerella sp.]|jgi:hypothetical protein|nr:hypothetical protein [Tannerella sp.]